jgi:hypothetical protein
MNNSKKIEKKDDIVLISSGGLFYPNIQKDYNFLSGSNRYKLDNFNSQLKLIEKQRFVKKEKTNTPKIINKKYYLNKKEVRNRIVALSNLKVSCNNLIFWSVSFPLHFTDIQAIKVLNNVLTSLRKGKNWFQYVWIAERQKNGTIHFHFVVNQWFNVRIVNYKFACAIENELKKENKYDIKFNKDSYNGFDVKKVYNSAGISAYVTKYVTKQNESFECRAWGCDRITGSLFLSCACEIESISNIEKNLVCGPDNVVKSFSNEFGTYFYFKGKNSLYPWKMLMKTNDIIYNLMITEKYDIKVKVKIYEFKKVESEPVKDLLLFQCYHS